MRSEKGSVCQPPILMFMLLLHDGISALRVLIRGGVNRENRVTRGATQ